MIVALGLDISVREKEYREDNRYHIPSGENQAGKRQLRMRSRNCPQHERTYVNVLATVPISRGSYHAENATMAGICSRQTCSA